MTSSKSKLNKPERSEHLIEKELEELQGIDTVYVDISKLTTIADGMWITTGRSKRHTQAIAENLMEKLKANGTPALSLTGYDNGDWILIDCGNYLVHVLLPAMRDLYQLEDLWKAAAEKQRFKKDE